MEIGFLKDENGISKIKVAAASKLTLSKTISRTACKMQGPDHPCIEQILNMVMLYPSLV
jgi:hypothetical protein